jgi:hypothetical protein
VKTAADISLSGAVFTMGVTSSQLVQSPSENDSFCGSVQSVQQTTVTWTTVLVTLETGKNRRENTSKTANYDHN